jgi:hypothetical protein
LFFASSVFATIFPGAVFSTFSTLAEEGALMDWPPGFPGVTALAEALSFFGEGLAAGKLEGDAGVALPPDFGPFIQPRPHRGLKQIQK